MRRLSVLFLLLIVSINSFAQQSADVEMAFDMRSSGKIYVVIATIVIIFAGLAVYLFSMDRRLRKIEKEK